jgi:hypothetical protein
VSLSEDWQKFVDRFDPIRFKRQLGEEAVKGMQKVGRTSVRVARKKVKGREYAENAPSTIKAKGSSMPLVNHGDLVGSIGFDVVQAGDVIMELGANKSVQGKKGRVNVAAVLHEGVKGVSRRHFGMVGPTRGVSIDFSGSGWTIPPRPYLQNAVDSQEVQDEFEKVVGEIVGEAVKP